MENKLQRNSNFELMRIISMLFIILWHIIVHGNINISRSSVGFIFELLPYFLVIHVNSFVLLTGYYQSKNKFKSSKVWSLITSSLFYKILIVVIFTSLGLIKLNMVDSMREFFFLNLDEYWFIKIYLFLYIISPILNKLIDNIDQKTHKRYILIMLLLFSIIPYITNNMGYNNTGYTLCNFIVLYFIGSYLRKYNIKNSYHFKNLSINTYRILLIFIFVFCVILNYSFFKTSYSLSNSSNFLNELLGGIKNLSLAYSNPIVIVQSIVYILLFETINFKNKFINKISTLTLGVYMIHDNNYVREYIYKWFNIDSANIYSFKFVLYVLVVSIIIFIICSIIELIRQLIFKFIYNRKTSKKIREKYYKYIKSL